MFATKLHEKLFLLIINFVNVSPKYFVDYIKKSFMCMSSTESNVIS